MSYQNIFKRYEIKYLLTSEQKEVLMEKMQDYMKPDEYGKSTICNIYFDTPDYLLIRRSLEGPVYKEKLRVRSYGCAKAGSTVFLELKKKYKGVVYKRRISAPLQATMAYLESHDAMASLRRQDVMASPGRYDAMASQRSQDAMANPESHDVMAYPDGQDTVRCIPGFPSGQITREIDYFCGMYKGLAPMVYIAYDREAFYGRTDHELRITFDENIRFRQEDLSLGSPVYGTEILKKNQVLMEVKIGSAMPLWLAKALSENQIYKTSFSKYGRAYEMMTGGRKYA